MSDAMALGRRRLIGGAAADIPAIVTYLATLKVAP